VRPSRLDDRRAEEARPIPAARPQRLEEAKRRLDEERYVGHRCSLCLEAVVIPHRIATTAAPPERAPR
jgi:hypothetical protein